MPIIRFKQSTTTDMPLSLQPGEPAVRLHPDRVDFWIGDVGGVPRQVIGGAGDGEGGWSGEPLSQPLIITGATDPVRVSLRGTTADGRSQIEMRNADGTTSSAGRIRHIPGAGIEFDVANTLAARLGPKGTAASSAETIMTREKADERFLARAGGEITGPVILTDTGEAANNPATRGFVTSATSGLMSSTAAAEAFVAKGGSTMTGQLTLTGDPTAAGHAVRKAYVDTGLATRITVEAATAAFAAKDHGHTEDKITDLNRLRWRSASTGTSWMKNDVINYAGSLYVANAATSQPPPGAPWELMTPGGASAYETWLSLGNEGTEQDFIDSLTYNRAPRAVGDLPDTLTGEVGDPDVTYDLRLLFHGEHLTYSVSSPATLDEDAHTARISFAAPADTTVTFTGSSPHGPDATHALGLVITGLSETIAINISYDGTFTTIENVPTGEGDPPLDSDMDGVYEGTINMALLQSQGAYFAKPPVLTDTGGQQFSISTGSAIISGSRALASVTWELLQDGVVLHSGGAAGGTYDGSELTGIVRLETRAFGEFTSGDGVLSAVEFDLGEPEPDPEPVKEWDVSGTSIASIADPNPKGPPVVVDNKITNL